MLVAHGLEAHFGAHLDLARILTVSTVAGVAGVVDELSAR